MPYEFPVKLRPRYCLLRNGIVQDNYELVERARAVKMTKFVENPSITIQIQACNFRFE